MSERDLLRSHFDLRGLSISEEQVNMLFRYYEILVEWNERMNLTSITEFEDVVVKHFLDSALILSSGWEEVDRSFSSLISKQSVRLLDVGTGAGFPGLVLAILRPSWEVTLLDSLNKRVEFLNSVVSELGLSHVHAIHGRAEDFGRDASHRLSYDLVVSRAVADLRLLLEFCLPFVSEDGFFVSYKGPKFEEELSSSAHALEELHSSLCFSRSFVVEESHRLLAGFGWVDSFPEKFPRRAGIPVKRPL